MTIDPVTDASYSARQIHGTVTGILGQVAPVSSQALGLSSPLGAIAAVGAAMSAGQQVVGNLIKCRKIESAAKRCLAYIGCLFFSQAVAKFVKAFTAAVAGLLYLPARFLAISGSELATRQ